MSRKPRADSVLKTLPEDRQRHIVGMMESKSLADLRSELRADGIHTSETALSEFRSWWLLRAMHRQNASDVTTVIDLLKKDSPEIPEEKLQRLGDNLFALACIKSQDPREWARIEKLKIERKRAGLEERRIQILERRAAQAEAAESVSQNAALTPEQKLARMKEIFGHP